MDLEKLSDDELHKLYLAKQTSNPSLDKMSDKDLYEMYKQKKSASAEPNIIQEMHPDFTTMDRLIVKNLSNSPESSIAYLKKQHPNMEISQKNGEVIGRNPGEKNFGVLDPDTGVHPFTGTKEFLRDAGDVAYDVLSGIPVQAATALGGAAGFASPIPGGTMMGAMGAGAAANSANEYLRQKLGQLAGIPQEVDPSQVKMAGAIGAASPALLGVGKAPGVAAIAKDGFDAASRGLLNRGAVGGVSLATGIPSQELREGFNRLGTVKNLENVGATGYAEEAQKGIKDTLDQARESSWQKIQNTLDKSNVNINLTEAKQKLQDLLTKYKNSDVDNSIMKNKISEVENTIKNVFGEDVPAQTAQVASGVLDQTGAPLMKTVETAPAKVAASSVSAKGAYELQNQLGEISDLNKSSFLSKLTGKDAADRELALTAKSAQKSVGDTLDKAISDAGGDSVNGLKSEYAQAATLQKQIAPKFATPEATYNTLRNLSGKNKQILFEKLGAMDSHYGTDVLEKAKDLQAYNRFSNASSDAISGGGSTSTSRTVPLAMGAGALGYHFGGYPAAAAAAFAASKAASPAAVRMGMEAINPLVKGAQYIPESAKNSVWNLMMNQKKAE
jgi:hypothetical protein